MKAARFRLGACAVLALVAVLAGAVHQAGAVSTSVVISQIYGGGGNVGGQYNSDFIELFNRSSASVDLSGWSVQYASATGTGTFGSATTTITPLSGSLASGQYLLVQEASGTTGAPLPAPFLTDSTPINMSATGGKVALVSSTTPLGCNGSTASPCSAAAQATIVDLIGYDGANYFEGAGAGPTLSNTTAAFRGDGGCTDTDDNAHDFTSESPAPRNSNTPPHVCEATGETTSPTITVAASPPSPEQGSTVTFTATVTPGTNPPSTGLSVGCDFSWAGLANPSPLFDDGTNGDPTAGDLRFTRRVAVSSSAATGQRVGDCHVFDDEGRDGGATYTITIVPATVPTAVHDIQGAAHISPFANQNVSNVRGIVTARRSNGFWMQDPNPDSNDATSEGIFVFTSSAPTVVAGDSVRVDGRVQEFRPGGAGGATNLTTTELTSPTVSKLSSGNELPAATIVGTAGRVPPSEVIENDATGDVETSGAFDLSDGIDFWESLEGMRVRLNDAVAVGPTNPAFGETPVIGDGGANAGVRTPRGGLLLRPDDGNPERVIADDLLVPLPSLNVGDGYDGPLVGVLDYNFGNFFLEVTSSVGRVDNHLQREVAEPAGANELSAATFNFENLDPGDPPSKFAQLADIVVRNLGSPDLIGGEEVQDNNGPANDSVVSSDATLDQLVAAIEAAGGPHYDYRYINPVDDQDGGEPGGNIRQVFLFRTDRGLSFVDRPGGTSTSSTGVTGTGDSTQLTFSPGRIAPGDSAWNASRKPLAGEFVFRGTRFFAVVNHFNSKGGDQPLLGHFQPPTRSSEAQRHAQAQLVAGFVSQLTGADANAKVVVLGDLNDFEFSETVQILKNAGLHDLIETLPQNERYSYEFEGNAQVLDHVLFSNGLFARPFSFDPVHVNAEFWDQASDHDPSVVRVTLNSPPTVSANGPYTVAEGGTVSLSATGSDPEGGALTYAWDLNNDGTFETSGQNASFSAAAIDGPASRTVGVRVTDNGGLAATGTATVNVVNVQPTAVFAAPASASAGLAFTLSLTSPHDAAPADTFTYAFDCGGGFGAFGSASTASCSTTAVGPLTVGGRISDDDGGVSTYTATVDVVVTFTSLCDLVQAYTQDAQTISQLCQRLDQAQKAPNAAAKAAHLESFRDLVDKSGVFTPAQADTLKSLSASL
ncbi:MAG: lamin tail domain-containing protein [Gaiellaceae bacterium]